MLMKKKTKTIFLSGGLGNNLFQISYADKISNEYDIVFNTYLQNDNWFTRKLGWSIHPTEICDVLLEGRKTVKRFNFVDFSFTSIVFLLSKLRIFDLHDCNKVPSFWNRIYSKFEVNFTANEEFFIKSDNKLDESEFNHIVEQFGLDVIHVRRGDFEKNIQLDIEYYKEAVNRHGGKSFVVVTNDKTVVDELRSSIDHVEFLDSIGKSQKEDFYILKNSRSIILSNSTFSYWASQIGNVPTIYYPDFIKPKKEWTFPFLQKNTPVRATFGGWL
jgi:hypothetical protein